MHKAGNQVVVSVEEIFQMKTNEKMFGRFVTLSNAWIMASSFKFARKTRADSSEWKTWLVSGLWQAISISDSRLQGIGMIYSLAWRDACKAYKAQYGNAAQKTEDACDSCHRDGEGNYEDIQIPSVDESFGNFEYNDFLSKLEKEIDWKAFFVIKKRLEGNTLEDIGQALSITREGVRKIFEKNAHKIKKLAIA